MSVLYYVAKNANNFYSLWKSNGTAAGTLNVLTPTQNFGSASPYGLTALDDDVIFAAQDPTGRVGVWVSGGTQATTFELVASEQGANALSPSALTEVGGHVLFLGTDANGKTAVFATAGVAGDPTVLLECDRPADKIVGLGAFALIEEASVPLNAYSPVEIWVTDGTAAHTTLLASNASGFDDFYDDFQVAKAGSEALLQIGGGVVAVTSATSGFVNIVSGTQGLFALAPSAFTVAGDDAFFTGVGTDGKEGLWFVSGATGKEIAEVNPVDMTAVGDDLVFEAADANGDDSLYWSDGTSAGTREIFAGLFDQGGGSPSFHAFGAEALFSVYDSSGKPSLWITNGQTTGTFKLAGPAQGLLSAPTGFIQAGSHLFFLAQDSTNNASPGVWSTGGSAAGAVELLSAAQGAKQLFPQDLTVYGDKIAFIGEDSSGRWGVFVSDGTVAGTAEALSFLLTAATPYFVGVAGAELVVAAADAKGVVSEWAVDGNPADSVQIAASAPGAVNQAVASVVTHASADLNGDGQSDALFQNGAQQVASWQLGPNARVGGGVLGLPGLLESVVGVGDSVGQGYGSLFFYNSRTGAIALWRMFGTLIQATAIVGAPNGTWRVFGLGDLNGDGKSDLVLRDDDGDIGVWELSGAAIVGGGIIGNPGANWTLVGQGDFNGDGKADLLFENQSGGYAAWLMNGDKILGGGTVIAAPGYNFAFEGTGDFNGDGTSDLLFYDVDTHAYSIDFLSKSSLSSVGQIANVPTSYAFKGVGDYNGDGKSDLLFENLANGHYIAWFLNGSTVTGTADYGAPGPTWTVFSQSAVAAPELPPIAYFEDSSGDERAWSLVGGQPSLGASLGPVGSGEVLLGAGDVFGDHHPDLLFQSASGVLTLWRTDGTHLVSQTTIGSDAGLSFVSFGDFNGDGFADLLFQAANGDDVIWSMNGAAVLSQTTLTSPGAGYNAVAAGDFTGDGASDILFQNASGAILVEAIGADQAIPGGGAVASPGAGWTIKGTGDFNGDGKTDILFANTSSLYAIWDMSGGALIGGGNIGTPPSTYQFKGIADLDGDHLASILFYDTATSAYVSWKMNDTSVLAQPHYGSPGAEMTFQTLA